MVVVAPASEACHMDSLSLYIKGMFDQNEEDLPQCKVERAAAERAQVLSNLLCFFRLDVELVNQYLPCYCCFHWLDRIHSQ